jgi:pimeloyl-ACP methyl ester carboxylesterase
MFATVDGAGGMRHLRVLGSEAATVMRLLLAMPLRPLLAGSNVGHATAQPPVVFVHGLLGDPTNFLSLRRFLARRGICRFASFSYLPRLDYPRLAPRLLEELRAVCTESGVPRVDVVGHSLGGLLARYVVETDGERLVRRLVTLAAPYTPHRNPPQELAIFASDDLIVPAPPPARTVRRRTLVVPHCGHLGLLCHPRVLRAVGAFLTRSSSAAPRALEVAA